MIRRLWSIESLTIMELIMKMVIAFIKPNKFNEVMLALHKIEGLTGASSSEVHGFGCDRTRHEDYARDNTRLVQAAREAQRGPSPGG